jgi:hypothetical protein
MNSIRASLIFALRAAALAALAASATAADPPGGPIAAAHGFDLVTDSEAADWNTPRPQPPADFSTRDLGEEGGLPTCRSTSNNDADNPQIRILAPALGRPLTAPLDIDVQFVPTASAPIRAETFRVCYVGFVTMDITKRITDRVTVTEQGLHVSGARLPHGHHHLLMLIADRRGRLGRRDAVIDID